MSSTQNFQFDVFNNTSRTLIFQITGNFDLSGAQGDYTISPGAWMSAQNNNTPFPLTLNGQDTGSLSFDVQVDDSTGAMGSFTLEFDGTPLTNFPGMAFYGSADKIANPVKTSGTGGVGYIFPLLYMNQTYAADSLAIMMLLEATGASPDVATPYGVV